MTSDTATRYLIAYDVPDDRRRTRLAKRLESYGDRVQYSVFISDVKPAKLVRLRSAIKDIIDTDEDSVLLCDLGPVRSIDDGRFTFLGRDRPLTPRDMFIT